jgi:hypothetical protein
MPEPSDVAYLATQEIDAQQHPKFEPDMMVCIRDTDRPDGAVHRQDHPDLRQGRQSLCVTVGRGHRRSCVSRQNPQRAARHSRISAARHGAGDLGLVGSPRPITRKATVGDQF